MWSRGNFFETERQISLAQAVILTTWGVRIDCKAFSSWVSDRLLSFLSGIHSQGNFLVWLFFSLSPLHFDLQLFWIPLHLSFILTVVHPALYLLLQFICAQPARAILFWRRFRRTVVQYLFGSDPSVPRCPIIQSHSWWTELRYIK